MATNRYPMARDELRARYPRLIRSMRWASILSEGEACGALYQHQIGNGWAGEAVNHAGGVVAVIRHARRCWPYVRTLRTATAPY